MKSKFLLLFSLLISGPSVLAQPALTELVKGFTKPPHSAKPGVYWYFMDGNIDKASMTKDLEAMNKAGIGNLIFLEVDQGVPRGKNGFMSEAWQECFVHAVRECERLDIELTLGVGPGWTGSGGPWVPMEQTMKHLVQSAVKVQGGKEIKVSLPKAPPHQPFFGEGAFTPELKKKWLEYYEDVAVIAYPTPGDTSRIPDWQEKALVYRAPYSSMKGVKPWLQVPLGAHESGLGYIKPETVLDITNKMDADGTVNWKAPKGSWTIVRLGMRNNGAVTRPAPMAGLGFECDKMDTTALKEHLDFYVGKLLAKIGPIDTKKVGGFKRLHMDSWEMGAQNWTNDFRQEFKARRNYDPLVYTPAYEGIVVGHPVQTEQFLWDVRQTAQELVLERHAGYIREYGRRYGLELSIEPYDMNPTSDLDLGAVADQVMAEFWSKGFGFNSSFACIEGTSIAHIEGNSIVPAESFTSQDGEGWKMYPGRMKNQTDWAFACGINRLVFHTFQNQFLPDGVVPGATMGQYGVHWDRNQTWWPMVNGYHDYVSRCQYLLQQGNTVADILYLVPEGAPHVFLPPPSAIGDDKVLPDRKGYNFDACSVSQLRQAKVKDGKIVFPGGGSYSVLMLPETTDMSMYLLAAVQLLVNDGATVVGNAPIRPPGLGGFPVSDQAALIWADQNNIVNRMLDKDRKGKMISGWSAEAGSLYPKYEKTASLLSSMNIQPDFESDAPIRYTHRQWPGTDVYFVSNTTDEKLTANLKFRSSRKRMEIWNPIDGSRKLPNLNYQNSAGSKLNESFEPYQSLFVIFTDDTLSELAAYDLYKEFTTKSLDKGWKVTFDKKLGGPKAPVRFDSLVDWTTHSNDSIKYYSGIATYRTTFDRSLPGKRVMLNLGKVSNMCRVKVNGKELGIVWTAPWEIEITSALKDKNNLLEIEVVNLWPNRIIGDEKLPYDGLKDDNTWPDWLVNGTKRTSGRVTFSTFPWFYNKESALLPSGLVGPVQLLYQK